MTAHVDAACEGIGRDIVKLDARDTGELMPLVRKAADAMKVESPAGSPA